jgi:hypothetical protein
MRHPYEDGQETRYHVISPDGIPVTREPFRSREAAKAYIPSFCRQFKEQPQHLLIAPEGMVGQLALNSHALEALIGEARTHVECVMRTKGRMPATLFLKGLGELKTYVAPAEDTLAEKKRFIEIMRLVVKTQGATALVLAVETWVRPPRPGEKLLGLNKEPSQGPNGQEQVALLGECYREIRQHLLPVMRADDGRFLGLGEGLVMREDSFAIAGGFPGLLPEVIPNAREHWEALATLKEKISERVRGKIGRAHV